MHDARARDYIIQILRMKEGRWSQICLREEVRGILNKNPSKWGTEFMKAMREVGDGKIIDLIWSGVRKLSSLSSS